MTALKLGNYPSGCPTFLPGYFLQLTAGFARGEGGFDVVAGQADDEDIGPDQEWRAKSKVRFSLLLSIYLAPAAAPEMPPYLCTIHASVK